MREYPPMLSGTPEQQLQQIRSYLVRLVDDINQLERDIESAAKNSPTATEGLVTVDEFRSKFVKLKNRLREQDIDV